MATDGDQRRSLLTLDAVATALSVSQTTVRRMVKRGDLPVVRIGGLTRYRPDDLDALIWRGSPETTRAGSPAGPRATASLDDGERPNRS